MNRRLTTVFGLMLFLLFIGGTILLPVFHRAHCADNDAAHKTADCPICQFANTPVIASLSAVTPVVELVVFETVDLQFSTLPASSKRDPTQPRAPPAC
jgi:hypothetical protein